ncbi:hypothetical protein SK128_004666 [Halocaridina rubra]|uniref:Uncharacterized protein n=1 Tax=Halocaridina rubra TaxID=373956 RepID=A0AAN8XTL7_HALRR
MKIVFFALFLLATLQYGDAFKCYDDDYILDYCEGSCYNSTTKRGNNQSIFKTSCWPDSVRTKCVENTTADGSYIKNCYCNYAGCNGGRVTTVALPLIIVAFASNQFI